MSNKKDLNISFWEKEQTGNALSHKAGLTPDQIAALKDLLQAAEDGEPVRLIVWKNNKRDRDTSPTHSLKVFRSRHDDGGL